MLTDDDLAPAVACAVRAPSVHNTQPWIFERQGDTVLVRVDTSRWLPAEDPLGRELTISCGGSVLHLLLGLRARGLDVEYRLVAPGQAPEDPDRVAVLRVVGHRPATEEELLLEAASAQRHTDRSAFSDQPVPDALLDQLRLTVEADGCVLKVIGEREVLPLATLLERGEYVLRADPQLRSEQRQWVTGDENPAEGLPPGALPDHGTGRGSPVRLRDFDVDTPSPTPSADPPRAEHPALVVLGTQDDDRLAWLQAGWALSDLLLRATAAGLVASPLTQALELPSYRERLARALGMLSHPQVVLRLGYPLGDGSPRTGRRPVDEVLTR